MAIRMTVERERRGWSRSELARRSRMAPGDVGKIERLLLKPYRSQVLKLARSLGIKPDELMVEVGAGEGADQRGTPATIAFSSPAGACRMRESPIPQRGGERAAGSSAPSPLGAAKRHSR